LGDQQQSDADSRPSENEGGHGGHVRTWVWPLGILVLGVLLGFQSDVALRWVDLVTENVRLEEHARLAEESEQSLGEQLAASQDKIAALSGRLSEADDLRDLPHLIASGTWFYRRYMLRHDVKSPQLAGACPDQPCFQIELQGITEHYGVQGQEVVVTGQRGAKGEEFCICATEVHPKEGKIRFAQLLSSDPPKWLFFVPLVKGTERCWVNAGQKLTLAVRDANINQLTLDATIREGSCEPEQVSE
jgi:hypothetical protein